MCKRCIEIYFPHLSDHSSFTDNECIWFRAMVDTLPIPQGNRGNLIKDLGVIWDHPSKNIDDPVEQQQLTPKLKKDQPQTFEKSNIELQTSVSYSQIGYEKNRYPAAEPNVQYPNIHIEVGETHEIHTEHNSDKNDLIVTISTTIDLKVPSTDPKPNEGANTSSSCIVPKNVFNKIENDNLEKSKDLISKEIVLAPAFSNGNRTEEQVSKGTNSATQEQIYSDSSSGKTSLPNIYNQKRYIKSVLKPMCNSMDNWVDPVLISNHRDNYQTDKHSAMDQRKNCNNMLQPSMEKCVFNQYQNNLSRLKLTEWPHLVPPKTKSELELNTYNTSDLKNQKWIDDDVIDENSDPDYFKHLIESLKRKEIDEIVNGKQINQQISKSYQHFSTNERIEFVPQGSTGTTIGNGEESNDNFIQCDLQGDLNPSDKVINRSIHKQILRDSEIDHTYKNTVHKVRGLSDYAEIKTNDFELGPGDKFVESGRYKHIVRTPRKYQKDKFDINLELADDKDNTAIYFSNEATSKESRIIGTCRQNDPGLETKANRSNGLKDSDNKMSIKSKHKRKRGIKPKPVAQTASNKLRKCCVRFSTNCSWVGPRNSMVHHVKAVHPSLLHTSTNQKMFILQFWKKLQKKYYALFNVFDNLFRFSYEIDAKNGKVTFGLYCLEDIPNLRKYSFEIVILKKSTKFIRLKESCFYIENDEETFLGRGYVTASYDLVKSCIDRNDTQGHLYFFVKIFYN